MLMLSGNTASRYFLMSPLQLTLHLQGAYMYKHLFTGAIGVALSCQAMAQSYQFEGYASYSKSNPDYDYGYDSDLDLASVAGTYYFSPVSTDRHPLQEASFFAKSSSLSFSYVGVKAESNYGYEDDYIREEFHYTSRISSFVIAAETYVFNDLIYLGGLVAHSKEKQTDTSTFYSDTYSYSNGTRTYTDRDSSNDWRVNLGIAPTEGLLIWSEFKKDVDISDSWNLNTKYVMEFNASALNIEGGIAKNAYSTFADSTTLLYPSSMKLNFNESDDMNINSIYVVGDYYFDKTLSLGIGANRSSVRHVNESYLIRGQKFFTDKFSVLLQYTTGEEIENYSIGASLRF